MDLDNLLNELLLEIVKSSSKEEVWQIIYDFELQIINSNLSFEEKNRITKQIMEVKSSYGLFANRSLWLNELKYALEKFRQKIDYDYLKYPFSWYKGTEYGIFGLDNTFNIAYPVSFAKNIRLKRISYYYLADAFSKAKVSASYGHRIDDFPWQSGNPFICYGIESYAIPLSKLGNYEHTTKRYIQDVKKTINSFLTENPNFVEEIFVRERNLTCFRNHL